MRKRERRITKENKTICKGGNIVSNDDNKVEMCSLYFRKIRGTIRKK